MTSCGCDPDRPDQTGRPATAVTANPPGQDRLRRRVTVHGASLARMRANLAAGGPGRPPALRTLARHPSDDPLIALLDTWAVVTDVVAFYSERIAEEGYLRTATERASVRELARTLGHELRPGVAAQVELAFEAETAAGAPASVRVAAGTPVQSVPGQDELPQTFETATEVEIRGAWNRLPARTEEAQPLTAATDEIWLRGSTTTVRPGATLLVAPEPGTGTSVADVRAVVEVWPALLPGWTLLRLDQPLTATDGARRHAYGFTDTARLFGHNAPDPSLLVVDDLGPPGSEKVDTTPPADDTTPSADTRIRYRWTGIDEYANDVLDLDGDHPGVLEGSWVVLEGDGKTTALPVESVTATGHAKWGLAGPVTAVGVTDAPEDLATTIPPRTAKVHCASVVLPAGEAPVTAPTDRDATTLVVARTDPPPPAGRTVLVVGIVAGERVSAAFTLSGDAAVDDSRWMTLTLDRPLGHAFDAPEVFGNVVTATHGESVAQPLGSGDGRTAFAVALPRRGPLTYVRAPAPPGAPPGARAELVVRVDGVAWTEVASLAVAGPADRVYVLRHEEDAPPRIVFGDGVHGAVPPTGEENIEAVYRVGIGQPGAVRADQLTLLPRRPLGTRAVTNPAPAQDWAPPETLEDARGGAPLLVRTLGRVVSVSDHADFARTYAGIGQARADAVWDGRRTVVVLSVLAVGGAAPSDGLLADLESEIRATGEPGTALVVRRAEVLAYDVEVDVEHDPAVERAPVEDGVRAALLDALGPAAGALARGVTAARALLVVRSVAGVRACTVPALLDDGHPPGRELLGALPARWEPEHADPLRPAQLRALHAVTVGEMTR